MALPNKVALLLSSARGYLGASSQFSYLNMISCVRHVMENVEAFKDMDGPDKKACILHCFRALVNTDSIPETSKVLLQGFIDNILPPMIDEFILISKNKSLLNVEKSRCCWWFFP
jgi:hypothetical protein